MKKFELNVVNFDNEDVIATSHEDCIGLVFSVDNPVQNGGYGNRVHYHVNLADGGTLGQNIGIDVDGDGTADYVTVGSSDSTDKGVCINLTSGETWNVHDGNQTEAETFAESLSGHYILVGDVYTKE